VEVTDTAKSIIVADNRIADIQPQNHMLGNDAEFAEIIRLKAGSSLIVTNIADPVIVSIRASVSRKGLRGCRMIDIRARQHGLDFLGGDRLRGAAATTVIHPDQRAER